MGTEISKSRFSKQDFENFSKNLRHETSLLSQWFRENRFSNKSKSLGLELEASLVDQKFLPAAKNEKFLNQLHDPDVVPELSKFNIELNFHPQKLSKNCLNKLHIELKHRWEKVQKKAGLLNLHAIMIGSLPTFKKDQLDGRNMSNLARYRALDHELKKLRKGKKIHLNLQGEDTLKMTPKNVMLEAAATSMQVHLQMEGEKMVDYYNASLIASAATVAVAANAPFLFGKSLWHDSRIPLFEQAVQVPGFFDVEGHLIQRVGFGSGYLHGSLLELFLENLYEFPVILPMNLRKKPEKLAHLHLHNGTIWRWNRPIVGFNQDGNHHLRIEHRVCSSGPTLVDIVGNVAFYLGLTQALVQENKKLLDQIPFDAAYKNFYQAAQYGFEGQMEWKGKNTIKLETLLKKQWVPMARAGLKDLGIADKDLEYYFEENIIPRIIKRQTGTHWQRKFIKKYGPDFKKLTQEYFQRQERDLPVHQWSI